MRWENKPPTWKPAREIKRVDETTREEIVKTQTYKAKGLS